MDEPIENEGIRHRKSIVREDQTPLIGWKSEAHIPLHQVRLLRNGEEEREAGTRKLEEKGKITYPNIYHLLNKNDSFKPVLLIDSERLEKIQKSTRLFITGFGEGIIDGLENVIYNSAFLVAAPIGEDLGMKVISPIHVWALANGLNLSVSTAFYCSKSMIPQLQSWAQVIASWDGIIGRTCHQMDQYFTSEIDNLNCSPNQKEQLRKLKNFTQYAVKDVLQLKVKQLGEKFDDKQRLHLFAQAAFSYIYKGTGHKLDEKSIVFQKLFDPLYYPTKFLSKAMEEGLKKIEPFYSKWVSNPFFGWYFKNTAEYFIEQDLQGVLREYNGVSKRIFEDLILDNLNNINIVLGNLADIINQYNGLLIPEYFKELEDWIGKYESFSKVEGRSAATTCLGLFFKSVIPDSTSLPKLGALLVNRITNDPEIFITQRLVAQPNYLTKAIVYKTAPFIKWAIISSIRSTLNLFRDDQSNKEKIERKKITEEAEAKIKEIISGLNMPEPEKEVIPFFERKYRTSVEDGLISQLHSNISECLELHKVESIHERLKASLKMIEYFQTIEEESGEEQSSFSPEKI